MALALVVGAGQGLRGHLEADAVEGLVALPAYSAGFAIDCGDDAVDLGVLLAVAESVDCAGEGACGAVCGIGAEAAGESNQGESGDALVAGVDVGGRGAVGQHGQAPSVGAQEGGGAGEASLAGDCIVNLASFDGGVEFAVALVVELEGRVAGLALEGGRILKKAKIGLRGRKGGEKKDC